jgi:hypothetical protein
LADVEIRGGFHSSRDEAAVKVFCEFCESEYAEEAGPRHDTDECIAALVRDRSELRSYLTREGPDHLMTENRALRSGLCRSENEKKMALEALTRAQRRATELLEEVRMWKEKVRAWEDGAYAVNTRPR